MEEEKRYKVVNDRQGGTFAMGRYYTIEEWRTQAIEWATMDDWEDEDIEYIICLKQDRVLEYISDMWDIDFAECNKVLYIVEESMYYTINQKEYHDDCLVGIYDTKEKAQEMLLGYEYDSENYKKTHRYIRECDLNDEYFD